MRDISLNNDVASLEIYESEASFRSGSVPEFVLDLKNVTHVDAVHEACKAGEVFKVKSGSADCVSVACVTPIEKQSWVEAVQSLVEKRKILYKKISGDAQLFCRLPQRSTHRTFARMKWSLGGSKQKLPACDLPRISGKTKRFCRSDPNIHQISKTEVPIVSNGPPTPPRRKTSKDSSASGDGHGIEGV